MLDGLVSSHPFLLTKAPEHSA